MENKTNKRKTASSVTDNTYGVIETVKGRGNVFVEFLPRIWLKPAKRNGHVNVRESAKFFYPRHTPDQTKEDYLKFLRNAKFECLQPANNKKWDLLDCRVLKIDIGSFDEAVNAEKLFSEYFNTTDAEAEMNPSVPQRSKKTKKSKAKVSYESESEDESPGSSRVTQVKEISCYDTAFKKPALHHDIVDVDATSETGGVADAHNQFSSGYDTAFKTPTMHCGSNAELTNEIDDIGPNNTVSIGEDLLSSCVSIGALGINNASPFDDSELINKVGTSIATEGTDQQNIAQALETPIIFEFVDQRKSSTASACHCKGNCCQKILNKMDYFQKKMLNEVGRYRQETMQAIRQFAERYDVLLKSEQFQSIVPQEDLAKQALDEEFDTQFTNDFPANTSLLIIETDKRIKTDREFRKRFIAKLKRKEKDANETKAVRQFLKSICAASCLSEFTWLGTQTKKSFSALESLIDVIALIVEEQFPKCDAYKIIKEVVQQRTKSAAEHMASLKKIKKQIAGVVKERNGTMMDDLDNGHGTNTMNDKLDEDLMNETENSDDDSASESDN